MAEEQHNTLTLVPDEMEHGAAYRLMLSVVVPRPIAWISTIGADGTPNLAPYSFFTGASGRPPTLLFSVSPARNKQVKDTLRNVQETGEFVVNLVSEELREAMNLTSGTWPYEMDEFEVAGLEALPSMDVRPPRVAASPVAMEAKVTQIIPVEGAVNTLVLGRVLRYHVREDVLRPEGLVDTTRTRPIARLGGDEYATIGEVFSMVRPRVDS